MTAPVPGAWRPAAPAARPVLFVNPVSGGGKARRASLAEHARERGIAVVTLDRGDRLADLVERAVADGADALGMAGGDGSLAVVAAVARTHDLPFVCVPAGTRNHFALDLGIDRNDLVGPLDAFGDGLERTIDVGTVNGRLFLNNVSLGFYGEAVAHASYRDAKIRTLLATVREVTGPGAAAGGVRLVDDRGREHRDPAAFLVSNNPYALDRPLVTGTRPALDTGRLGLLVVDPPRAGAPPARAWTAASFVVDAPGRVHAGVDGEAVELLAPLDFASLPFALRVRISSAHPGVSPSGRLL